MRIRYNVASGKLTFGDSYHYKPDSEGLKRLEQQWELSDLPIEVLFSLLSTLFSEAQRAHLAAANLREGVEAAMGGDVKMARALLSSFKAFPY